MKRNTTTRGGRAVSAARFAEATNLALISVDGDGDIEFVNASACSLFGYDRNEMLGRPITIIIPERMRGAHTSGLARVAAGEKPNLGGKTVEVFALKKDGSEFPIEITLSVWEGKEGMSAGAVIKDISERRERESRLLRLASQDTLTGLHNKHQFMHLLDDHISAGKPATVVLIDLDGFKEVNDTHGHAVGDSLLQAIGVRLPYLLPSDAIVARLGGDEFGVFFPASAIRSKPTPAPRKSLFPSPGPFISTAWSSRQPPASASPSCRITAAMRKSCWPVPISRSTGRRRRAGAATVCSNMRCATRHGRAAPRADDLRRALRAGELELYYQPQVRLATGVITGFEALIRWNHPKKGLLLPGAFLPALEQSALALEIGWWTLDEACRQIARLNRDGGSFKVAVNLFPAQFRALNLLENVAEAIARHGISPACLELEITEEVALNSDERSLKTLTALRDMGVGIAFDDFGTGYASLFSLKRYPLTTLKIDRGFVRDLQTDQSSTAITRALIGIGNDLGLITIAEGIETAEQEAALLRLGCPSGQGYRYGKPMPEADIDTLLREASLVAGPAV